MENRTIYHYVMLIINIQIYCSMYEFTYLLCSTYTPVPRWQFCHFSSSSSLLRIHWNGQPHPIDSLARYYIDSAVVGARCSEVCLVRPSRLFSSSRKPALDPPPSPPESPERKRISVQHSKWTLRLDDIFFMVFGIYSPLSNVPPSRRRWLHARAAY